MERKFDYDDGHSKIRKRGCSSSSSSSLVRRYRFKRAILVGKRGGSSTPVPTWKTGRKSPALAAEAAAMENYGGEIHRLTSSKNGIKGGGGGGSTEMAVVSARKLAATLWEINDVPSPRGGKTKKKKKDFLEEEVKKEKRSRERSSQSGSLPPHLSDPSHSPVSERIDRPRGGGNRRRMSAISQKMQLTEYNLGEFDSVSIANMVEIEPPPQIQTPGGYIVGIKTRLKDVSNGLVTSKELLKVLNRVWGLEDHHSSSVSIVSALKVELDRARFQVDQLIHDQRSNQNVINHHLKHFAEEKAAWRSKERERIREAISSMAAELEVEKKLRRQTERLNKKLGKELADTKASLSKALKELESEKRARDVLEQVCDELAKGIGEDRAEVEELKRESAKAREEVEKEREMLQLADILREERVQMKLSEAKYHFEEKNAAVDKLKSKLEGYLRNKIGREKRDGSPESGKIEELRNFLRNAGIDSCRNQEKELDEGQVEDGEHEEEDSAESDLHSIELNMDKNNRSYEWNFACGDASQDDSRRSSVEVFKGRKSLSEKIQWGSICLNRGTSDGMECEFSTTSHDEIDKGKFSDVASQAQINNEDEIKRYKPMNGVRDQLLCGSRLASVQGFSSPIRQWGQSLPLQDPGSAQLSPRVLQASTFEGKPSRH